MDYRGGKKRKREKVGGQPGVQRGTSLDYRGGKKRKREKVVGHPGVQRGTSMDYRRGKKRKREKVGGHPGVQRGTSLDYRRGEALSVKGWKGVRVERVKGWKGERVYLAGVDAHASLDSSKPCQPNGREGGTIIQRRQTTRRARTTGGHLSALFAVGQSQPG